MDDETDFDARHDTDSSLENEVDTETITHWGCQFVRKDGTVYLTRWDPTYGGTHFEPYTEAEARADVNSVWGWPKERKRLVTRTETTVVTTTPWEVVD